jgi:uncharacterized protein YndB with AHSA1/START domain
MWTHEESIDVAAPPERIWKLFADVPNWKRWNAGIESIAIHGPFVTGTTFSMKPPGVDAFTSTLVDVRENENFTDETIIEGTRFVVRHALTNLRPGHTRVSYSTEISGPAAAEFGPMITADFPDVLAALKRLAESQA